MRRIALSARIFIAYLLFMLIFPERGPCAELFEANYYFGNKKCTALICKPDGNGPFPAVVYIHGKIVDVLGYRNAKGRGYDMEGICRALASNGFFVFAPIRKSGKGNKHD